MIIASCFWWYNENYMKNCTFSPFFHKNNALSPCVRQEKGRHHKFPFISHGIYSSSPLQK